MDSTFERRYYDARDIAAIYGTCEKVAGQMIRRIRVVLYPPQSAAEKDSHPLPVGKVYVSDLPIFEDRMREMKGKVNAG